MVGGTSAQATSETATATPSNHKRPRIGASSLQVGAYLQICGIPKARPRSWRERSSGALGAQHCGEVADRFGKAHHLGLAQLVEFLVQQFDFKFRFDIDLVVVLGRLAIDVLLPVLAHHYEGRGVRSLKRKREIEQNEGIWIPSLRIVCDIE